MPLFEFALGTRRLGRCVLIVLAVGVLLAEPGARVGGSNEGVDALLHKYRCEVAARLLEIHATPHPEDAQNRFLILSRTDEARDYVQCAFEDLDRTVYCETSSGAQSDEPRTMYLPASAIAAVGRLGFTTDGSKENFKLRRPVDWRPSEEAALDLAELMLRAEAAAFGTTAKHTLTLEAPDAPDIPGDDETCH